jgi:hypothetical protein
MDCMRGVAQRADDFPQLAFKFFFSGFLNAIHDVPMNDAEIGLNTCTVISTSAMLKPLRD